jgi:membrane-associated protein
MELLEQAWDIIGVLVNPRNLSRPEKFQEALAAPGVFWAALVAVCAIVFAETGLLVGCLLPGDSLLVVLGVVAQLSDWNLLLLIVPICAAGIVGDFVGYRVGRRYGPAIFSKPDGRFFKKSHLEYAREYYEKHGGKTIVIARFMPFLRTFAPVVAGAAQMPYRRFVVYNIVGGVGWVTSMILFGYYLIPIADPICQPIFGQQFTWKKNIDLLAAGVIFLSIAPLLWKALSAWRAKRRAVQITGVAGAVK